MGTAIFGSTHIRSRVQVGAGETFTAAGLEEVASLSAGLPDGFELDHLAVLDGLPVTSLGLGDVVVGGDGFDVLGGLPKLTELSLSPYSNFEASDLKWLGSFAKLQRLVLVGATTTPEAPADWSGQLAALLEGLDLRSLTLWDVVADERVVAALAAQTNLRDLDAHNVPFTADPRALGHLTKLRTLFIGFCDIELGEWIGNLTRLERLIFEYGPITTNAIRALPRLNRLRELTLYGLDRGFSRYELEAFARLQHVEKLCLSESRLSWFQLRSLRRSLPHCRITYSKARGGPGLFAFDDPMPGYDGPD